MQPGIKSSYRTPFKLLLQAFEQTKLWIMHYPLPHSPRGWCFFQILHSPLLYFCLFLLSDPVHLALFPSFPSSRQPFSSDGGQRSSFDGLLWDKSLLMKIQQPLFHIFVTTVNGVNSRLGLTSSQMLLKVPQTWIILAVFLKKNQLEEKNSRGILFLSQYQKWWKQQKATRGHRGMQLKLSLGKLDKLVSKPSYYLFFKHRHKDIW